MKRPCKQCPFRFKDANTANTLVSAVQGSYGRPDGLHWCHMRVQDITGYDPRNPPQDMQGFQCRGHEMYRKIERENPGYWQDPASRPKLPIN